MLLLDMYHVLNAAGQSKALEQIKLLAKIPEYRKDNIIQQPSDKTYLEPIAAHERTDTEVTNEMRKHDDDLMDNDDLWK